jgi:hypothetical protein
VNGARGAMPVPVDGAKVNYSSAADSWTGVASVGWQRLLVLVLQVGSTAEINVGGVLTPGVVGPGVFYTHERERPSSGAVR